MKRLGKYLLALLLIPAFYACKSFEGAKVAVKPDPLEVHADSVEFTVRAVIPPKSGIKKGGTYMGQIVIQNDGNTYQMTRVNIPFAKYPDIKKKGASITVGAIQPYEPGMNGGMLMALNRYERKGKTVELPDCTLAPCCITTSLLVCREYQYLQAEHEYESRVPITLEAKFLFPQDVSKIQPSEYEKSSIEAIGEFLEQQYEATRITLQGYASPEGPYSRNEELAIERLTNVQEWLIEKMKEEGYDAQLDSSFFRLETTTEDWEGFKANLDQTNYPEDVKRQIIEIISAGYDPAVTEKKVLTLVGGVDEVEFILAPLRRTTIRVEGYNTAHTEEQIESFVSDFVSGSKDNKDAKRFFQQEEMLYAAMQQEDTDAREKLLTAYTRLYPDDFRGYNNLGVLALQNDLPDEALDYLTIADKKSPNNHVVLNNLGVVYLQKNNYPEALDRLQSAYSNKNAPEVAFNMGVGYEKTANYAMGSDMFDAASDLGCADFNAGLCKLLMGDLAGAKSDIENAIRQDKNNAMAYYLLAIVGARSGDANLMTLNLKRAVQIDRMLADKAVDDLEFRKYHDNAEFNVAIQTR